NESLEARWNGDYRAVNGVAYRFTQSYFGRHWSTSQFTPSTAADGTRTGTSRYDYGGSYRSDLTESDQAGNLPAAPATPAADAPIPTTLPDDFGAGPGSATFLRREFSAGTYSGWTRYES